MPTFPQNPNDIRGPIESYHNKARDDREKQYIEDRVELDTHYRADLQTIQDNKRNDMITDGLNPDGSTPSDYTPDAPSPG